jgi:hypothetical protein
MEGLLYTSVVRYIDYKQVITRKFNDLYSQHFIRCMCNEVVRKS